MHTVITYPTLFGHLTVLKGTDTFTLMSKSLLKTEGVLVTLSYQELRVLLEDGSVSCNNNILVDSNFVTKVVLDEENLQIKMYYDEGMHCVKFKFNDWLKLINHLVSFNA